MKKILLNQHGFSLAELLVAIVIMLLILSILVATFTLDQKVFRVSAARAELVQNGRIVSDLMEREIRQAQTIVTTIPADNSNPGLIPHELQFQDGHTTSQIQYIRYYLTGTNLKRQIIVYYFNSSPSTYVHYNDTDAFGGPHQQVLEDRLIGEFFTQVDYYGQNFMTIDFTLNKNNVEVNMQVVVNPRNS